VSWWMESNLSDVVVVGIGCISVVTVSVARFIVVDVVV